ncbi:putative enzyme related to lactoylglutathione lyase [Saccharothrix tamanrassetensis]|uniref:Putative enzyme related to lactoylglutathione lyase n=1 Tax=Saccharothrix tamanrassetensis TaxID=1051531 RepID=A0A841CAU3_9PSEU|nr:VOC family protein [Saccharothrix tamanrassetensis]MBB5955632.1 putative enzyme related to lactoylglutathione lyase [Saccharothrix tamanrassetensis]
MTFTIGMITIDTPDPHKLADFWTKALATEVLEDWGEFMVLAPPAEGGVQLGLQRVDDPTPGKNRVHFDTHVADRVAEVARLVGLGATEVAEHTVPGLTWTVLEDPEGNQFCVGQPG